VLAGQIDRLEIYRKAGRIQRLKIIDYKTSRRLKDYAKLLMPERFGSEDLQMPVYALGAVEEFRSQLSPEATIEASYFALKHRDKESEPQAIPLALFIGSGSSKTATTQTPMVADRILGLIQDAVAGQFDVDPLHCSEYCPYRRICRYRKPLLHQ
jgi:ATP-dependent helicase/DNAse subunit B